MLVHASRVIHIAEDVLDDEVYGVPRLHPISNRLDDLDKVIGGGAEGYYRDHRRRLVTKLLEGFTLRPEDREQYQQEMAELTYGFKDSINVTGMDVQQLLGTVASPKEHVDVILNVIAATLRMSKSALIGAEQGTLASAAEEGRAWKEQVSQRQQQFAEPVMLRPLLDRLLALGALPMPAQPYKVDWVNLHALSEAQQATVAKERASAYNQYEAARVGALNAGLPPRSRRKSFARPCCICPRSRNMPWRCRTMFPSDKGQAEDDDRPVPPSEETGLDEETAGDAA